MQLQRTTGVDATASTPLDTSDARLQSSNLAYRRIGMRIAPFLLFSFVICNIDRMNAGFAALDFEKDLGFGPAVYGLGASLFFIGYALFELPSNLILDRIGARKTFVRIMILWGLASAAQAFVKTPTQFYVVRALLGAAEAGFLPGAIFYLTRWFPSSRRARIQSLFYIGMPVAGIIGSPISGAIMHVFADTHGMKGWQWMFILEAAPTVLLALYAWFFLIETPAEAPWLTEQQRKLVSEDLLADEKTRAPAKSKSSLLAAVREPGVWVSAFTYLTLICTSSAMSFWMPSLIKSLGFRDPLTIGGLAACPAIAMFIWMLCLSRHSDRTLERKWHLSGSLLAGSACLVAVAIFRENALVSLALITAASGFIAGTYPVFWAIPSAILPRSHAAAGIGLIGGIGSLGGLLGASVFGWARAQFGSFSVGLYFIAAIIAMGAIVMLVGTSQNPVKR
ncbi:MFS transporter [Burkholderia cepacia]|uniref:MFS transporter n=1 Tax=Burkholderia cepacia TaxID=292 RepID=UPI001CF526CB|nr:MFS transporter [Burkholderia cepacia]MCA8031008.1 MFS transporter [Burkholderia cepacia]